jgi:ribosomal protein S12 methylthiotransferase
LKKFKIVFLGCPKNLVDTEYLIGSLIKKGFEYSNEGEYVFIQTCAFIKDAINESYKVIKKYVEKKKRGEIKFIGVGGCPSFKIKK